MYIVLYVLFAYCLNYQLWRSVERARSISHATIQVTFRPLDDLKVIWILLWCNEVVTDEEIDQDQPAIWLEFSFVKRFDDFWEG